MKEDIVHRSAQEENNWRSKPDPEDQKSHDGWQRWAAPIKVKRGRKEGKLYDEGTAWGAIFISRFAEICESYALLMVLLEGHRSHPYHHLHC
jgi:hypothetical protein